MSSRLEKIQQQKQALSSMPTDAVLTALRRPWYQIVGGVATRSAAAQILADRPADLAKTLPLLSESLGDKSKEVVGEAAEALCALTRKGRPSHDDFKMIAAATADALHRNLFGLYTPMLLNLLARCGAVATTYISRIEMTTRWAHLAKPPFVGRLQILWANCALLRAGAPSTEPLKIIGEIVADYAKSLTQSPADRIAEMSRSLDPSASGVSLAAAFFADSVSGFGLDLNLLDVLELLGGLARPIRPQLDVLRIGLKAGDAKRRLEAVLAALDQPPQPGSAVAAT